MSTGLQLHALDDLRAHVLAFLGGLGLSLLAQQPRPEAIDLVFTTTSFDRPRRLIARVTQATPDPAGLADLHATAAEERCTDYLLVSPASATPDTSPEHLLAGDDLAAALRGCWVLEDRGVDGYVVDRDAWRLMNQVNSDARPEERLLLRSVLALSRNTVPAELQGQGSADDLFERATFQLLTGILHLDGRRMGSATRGQRVGDALIAAPTDERPILLDCKAARRGYRMDIDDERRLIEYATRTWRWRGADVRPSNVLIVSSGFGEAGAQNPFHTRRAAFAAADSALAYVRADDLVAAVLALSNALRDDTEQLARLPWTDALCGGLVTRADLLAVAGSH